ncbi:MAG TPA: flagellar protein FlgN [Acidimicrobiales bacterium]|nr:flagellar protein FlgN [Acidimicrobiales bacterium]
MTESARDLPLGDRDCRPLIECLAEEQGALEHLLFKLREQHLVLVAGEHRWLAACTAEVEAAVTRLTGIGQRREQLAAAVHAAHGLPPRSNISALADHVEDELTCQVLLQRQRSLRDALDQVRRCSRQNRELLAQGLAATNDALALLGTVPTYDANGTTARSATLTGGSFDARA